jgi:hypothetical protein
MNRLQALEMVRRNASLLRAWEDMRIEVLHEIQDGGSVQDERMNAAGDIAALETPWRTARPPAVHVSRIHVN